MEWDEFDRPFRQDLVKQSWWRRQAMRVMAKTWIEGMVVSRMLRKFRQMAVRGPGAFGAVGKILLEIECHQGQHAQTWGGTAQRKRKVGLGDFDPVQAKTGKVARYRALHVSRRAYRSRYARHVAIASNNSGGRDSIVCGRSDAIGELETKGEREEDECLMYWCLEYGRRAIHTTFGHVPQISL
ncbi:uncharacterized protein BO66DRAFT_429550 [Aspergillus aculeatinus CBS 121060]|uniref:Uncharacterized protein n=1 Tax=Aspergillus aculeatinus CBS 121060 TaxID=1448322 RepID=A0ACD1H6R6_9EURO|nr:hypothetical protein BO66DRAFT_429550 [Aspergillus aculeatinus CBS 121060]RAH69193.1 hypothetical protein BO66DRAFT_429550 [Aspergillus aculeatinus CBS 121060]